MSSAVNPSSDLDSTTGRRMARFSGAQRGIAVWLWAVAVISAVAGAKYDLLTNLNRFRGIPIHEGTLTTAGVGSSACSSTAESTKSV